jgi:hypothetical protein
MTGPNKTLCLLREGHYGTLSPGYLCYLAISVVGSIGLSISKKTEEKELTFIISREQSYQSNGKKSKGGKIC